MQLRSLYPKLKLAEYPAGFDVLAGLLRIALFAQKGPPEIKPSLRTIYVDKLPLWLSCAVATTKPAINSLTGVIKTCKRKWIAPATPRPYPARWGCLSALSRQSERSRLRGPDSRPRAPQPQSRARCRRAHCIGRDCASFWAALCEIYSLLERGA